MPDLTDPYRMLQVSPEAEIDVIRAAYRILARKHHPDVGGSEAAMVRLNEAWHTLSDPVERARYNRRRNAAARVHGERPRDVTSPETAPPTPAPPTAAPPTAAAAAGTSARNIGATVLDFGRYAGWSLAQLATSDPDYLEWLARTPLGRRLQREIEAQLALNRQGGPRWPGARSRASVGTW